MAPPPLWAPDEPPAPPEIEPELLQSVPRKVELRVLVGTMQLGSSRVVVPLLLLTVGVMGAALVLPDLGHSFSFASLLVPGAFLLLGGFLMGAMTSNFARERELVSIGQPVLAHVEKVTGQRQHRTIQLCWKDESGALGRERVEVDTSLELALLHPQQGQTLTVLIHPTNPKRFVIYKLSRYKAVESLAQERVLKTP